MKQANWWTVLNLIFIPLSYAAAVKGFLCADFGWTDAHYHAAQLFVLECPEITTSNLLIEVCRFLCPAITASFLLSLIRTVMRLLRDSFVSFLPGATAIYCDNESDAELDTRFALPVFMGKQFNRFVKSHVLMLEKDEDNLAFFKKISPKLRKNSKVYIKLDRIDPHLLGNQDHVHYFSPTAMVAREYWKERKLIDLLPNSPKEKEFHAEIAIIGFDTLGQDILKYGLMNNIYSLNQSIHYHVWGENKPLEKLYTAADFDMMNEDSVIFHSEALNDHLEDFLDYDRIIITQPPNMELLQNLIYLNSKAKIHFYDPIGISAVFDDKCTPFGTLSNILTEENIKTNTLYRMAQIINYDYLVNNCGYCWAEAGSKKRDEDIEAAWNERSNFLKDSNIASADYHNIRIALMNHYGMDKDNSTDMEILAKMEHIRWSRFHFVNHWIYDPSVYKVDQKEQKTTTKDANTRRHSLLCKYEELSQKVNHEGKSESSKDKDVINILHLWDKHNSQ